MSRGSLLDSGLSSLIESNRFHRLYSSTIQESLLLFKFSIFRIIQWLILSPILPCSQYKLPLDQRYICLHPLSSSTLRLSELEWSFSYQFPSNQNHLGNYYDITGSICLLLLSTALISTLITVTISFAIWEGGLTTETRHDPRYIGRQKSTEGDKTTRTICMQFSMLWRYLRKILFLYMLMGQCQWDTLAASI